MSYIDNSGIKHESYEAACYYYGADTPAQCEAEARYWAEEEAALEFNKLANDALVISRQQAGWILDPTYDECPF